MKTWLIDKEDVLSYVAQKIGKDELVDAVNVLRYNLGYAGLISSRGTKVQSSRKSSKIEENVKLLSSILLPEQIQKNISQDDHIIVIPEHVIGQIPFYLLKTNEDEYLIARATISMAPAMMDSTRFMAFMQNELLNQKVNFNFNDPLVVGNPIYAPELNMAQLPGAEKEAKEIASYIGTTPVIGEEATLSNLNDRLKQSDFLYLATHGISKSDYAMDSSYIVLSPDLKNPLGKWTAREIMNFDISAKMAVMSACETGFGQVHEGGTIGLPSAFYLAGVDHSVLSYWPVGDLLTLEFMKIYIRKLKEPKYGFPSKHLREAILEYKEQNPDPHDWAAFMVYGYPY